MTSDSQHSLVLGTKFEQPLWQKKVFLETNILGEKENRKKN